MCLAPFFTHKKAFDIDELSDDLELWNDRETLIPDRIGEIRFAVFH